MWCFRFRKSEIIYLKNQRIRNTWHEQSYISLILLMSSLSTRFIGLYWKWVSCNMPSFVLAENGTCNKWIVWHEYEFCIMHYTEIYRFFIWLTVICFVHIEMNQTAELHTQWKGFRVFIKMNFSLNKVICTVNVYISVSVQKRTGL